MLKVLIALSFVVISAACGGREVAQATPNDQVCSLKVTGMTCAGCEAAVKIATNSVEGVSAVAVSYERGRAEVRYDPKRANPSAIANIITKKTGYAVELAK